MENFNPQFQKIGDILVYQKLISNEQLENALIKQKSSNEKLGLILIQEGIITEDELVIAYSMQCGHRAISEEDILKVEQSIVSLLPEDFAKENNVIALSKKDNYLAIAMEDPEDLTTLDSPSGLQGVSLRPLLNPPDRKGKKKYAYSVVSRGQQLGYALRNQRWRYGKWPDGEELYNLTNDPEEKKNLAKQPQVAERLEEFRKLLAEKQRNAASGR